MITNDKFWRRIKSVPRNTLHKRGFIFLGGGNESREIVQSYFLGSKKLKAWKDYRWKFLLVTDERDLDFMGHERMCNWNCSFFRGQQYSNNVINGQISCLLASGRTHVVRTLQTCQCTLCTLSAFCFPRFDKVIEALTMCALFPTQVARKRVTPSGDPRRQLRRLVATYSSAVGLQLKRLDHSRRSYLPPGGRSGRGGKGITRTSHRVFPVDSRDINVQHLAHKLWYRTPTCVCLKLSKGLGPSLENMASRKTQELTFWVLEHDR